MSTDLLHKELTYYLRGVAFRIHAELKGGHQEEFYQTAFVWALDKDGIDFQSQPTYYVEYNGKQVGKYRPDLIINPDKVLIDYKSQPRITHLHKAQMISYLAVTQIQLGMIMNFGTSSMQFDRLPNFLCSRAPFEWTSQIIDGPFPDLRNTIIRSLHKVHHTLGSGFLSQVYRRATRIELSEQLVNFEYMRSLPLSFDGNEIADIETRLFWIDNRILLATFALKKVNPNITEKLRWAMKATNCQIGILANFYPQKLDIRVIEQ